MGDVLTSAVTTILNTANFTYPVELPPVNQTTVRVRVGTVEEAKYYFSYAVLSYCKPGIIKEWKCRSCQEMGSEWLVQEVVQDVILETQGVVAVNHKRKEIGVVFRGSIGLNNQLQNSLFQFTDVKNLNPEIKVHYGFNHIADGLRLQVLTAIKALREQKHVHRYNLTLTGHSMGGAVAVIMSMDIQRQFNLTWERIAIYTYGQPRTGNLEFVNYYNSLPLKVTRVVNENDVVPHLPTNFQGYFHTLTEMYIHASKTRICSPRLVEDDSCSRTRINDLSKDSHDIAWGRGLGDRNCQPYNE